MPSPRRIAAPAGVRRQTHGNPRLQEEVHDPYRSRAKLRGPCRCKQCGATYLKGRWRWQGLQPPAPATAVCPACRRGNDRYPAGEVTVRGTFVATHGDEARRLIENVAAAESGEHPLHRIMTLRQRGGAIEITTTDVHLPRRIGHALENAWGGTLTAHYDEQGHYARVTWQRDE